jgi:hypothetical protein
MDTGLLRPDRKERKRTSIRTPHIAALLLRKEGFLERIQIDLGQVMAMLEVFEDDCLRNGIELIGGEFFAGEIWSDSIYLILAITSIPGATYGLDSSARELKISYFYI